MLDLDVDARGVRRVTLAAGRGNALDRRLLDRIREVFEPAGVDAAPVVICGEGRSFCTGLDLVSAWELDRDGMRSLMESFHRAMAAVLLWPGPVVAAIHGHALAGGAILALAADRRLMAFGAGRFGIHGVQLGVVYPDIAIELLRWRLPRIRVEDLLYGGRLRPEHVAAGEGLVDVLVDPDELLERASQEAREMADGGFARTKALLQHDLAARLQTVDEAGMDAWLDRWFAPETRERLSVARSALLDRNRPRPGETDH